MKTRASLLICTSPRSGSWLLAKGLAGTGLVGHPQEFFTTDGFWATKLGISSSDQYVEKILEAGTTDNGWFGAKTHWSQFAGFMSMLAEFPAYRGFTFPRIVASAFPSVHYLWLTRGDKARQAVSWFRARATDQWWLKRSPRRSDSGETDPRPLPRFDFDEIARLETHLLRQDEAWRQYFADAGVQPISLTYETLVPNYEKVIVELLADLGIAPPAPLAAIPPPRTEKQADGTSEEWVERYRALKAQSEARA